MNIGQDLLYSLDLTFVFSEVLVSISALPYARFQGISVHYSEMCRLACLPLFEVESKSAKMKLMYVVYCSVRDQVLLLQTSLVQILLLFRETFTKWNNEVDKTTRPAANGFDTAHRQFIVDAPNGCCS